ncbi:MAG: EAL domain-containing response regulator [Acidobacteriaceae bacterium]
MEQPKRLLVLDDEIAVAQTVAWVAESVGFETRVSTTPEELLRLIAQWEPSHLAIDLVMPGMDGIEVLRALADMNCSAAIIVMSGMGVKVLESAQRATGDRGLNIAGLLPKPFQARALRDLLNAPTAQNVPLHNGEGRSRESLITKDDLAAAIVADEFLLHYQPKIRLADGQIVGFEALLRWQHPTRGLVFPDAFIPMAEQSGCIVPITYRIFEIGLDWLRSVDAQFSLSLAINLSAINFTDLQLADRLQETCRKFQVDPRRINLELTETSAMNGSAMAFDVLTRLRIKGFSLGIDDFGTGYSSMVQLAQMPFSELKIDRSFVLSMLRSQESRTIVESTISLGKRLGLTTVAEGVEDAATMRTLRELGCDIGQGYFFARPMRGEDTRSCISTWDASRIV